MRIFLKTNDMKKIEEFKEHLLMNGYCEISDWVTNDVLEVEEENEEDICYFETMLKDRKIKYIIKSKEK